MILFMMKDFPSAKKLLARTFLPKAAIVNFVDEMMELDASINQKTKKKYEVVYGDAHPKCTRQRESKSKPKTKAKQKSTES